MAAALGRSERTIDYWRKAGAPILGRGPTDLAAVCAWLRERTPADNLGVATSNHYVRALKGFGNWLERGRRVPKNPFAHLVTLNAAADVRRGRRPLGEDEFARLYAAARAGGRAFGLTGEQRALLYLTAAYTGLRARELASLTPASFDLAADPPTVTIEAAYSKRRRRDVLPLLPAVAERVAAFLPERSAPAPQPRRRRRGSGADAPAGRKAVGRPRTPPTATPLWPGGWRREAAAMLRTDLAAARAAWIAEGASDAERAARERSDFLTYRDGADRQADFHALRHTFASNLARAGVAPKAAQALARHSTITLTLDTYSHLGVFDLTGALESLPPLPPDGTGSEPRELAATGPKGGRRNSPRAPASLRQTQRVAPTVAPRMVTFALPEGC